MVSEVARRLKLNSLSMDSLGPLFAAPEVERIISKDIVPLNAEPLFRIERISLEKRLRQIAKHEEEIADYFANSRPAFFHWFRSTFGERHAQARALERELNYLHIWVTNVRTEASLRGVTESSIVHQIQPIADFLDPLNQKPFSWEPLPLTRESVLGTVIAKPRWTHATEAKKIADSDQRRAREIYVELARKMHPDHNPLLSDRMRELWFQVQTAWETRDLEALEVIQVRILVIEQGWTTAQIRTFLPRLSSLSGIRRISKELKGQILDLQGQISECKRDAAWKFSEISSSPARLKKLQMWIDSEAAKTVEVLEQSISEYRAMLAQWAEGSRRVSPPENRAD